MLGISVELGTYSIKFLNFKVEKKSIKLLNTDEVVIDKKGLDPDDHDSTSLWTEQLFLIHDYLKDIKSDFQLLLTLPTDIISTRFIQLPLKNKKKASLMLPFQIEEDLPYSLSDCHWAETLEVIGDITEASVGIVRKEHFDVFFNEMVSHNVQPQVLTSDFSVYDNFVSKYKEHYPSDFCIMNIGHDTTRAFYFHNSKLVSTHQSYTAGLSLTESISKTYAISHDEATLYKHQNSFLLLEEQYTQVNENQREFAKVMDTALAPLLSDIKRWDIGFRVKHGVAPKEIYICGGSSNIKNIDHYLTAKVNTNVIYFDPYKQLNSKNIDPDEKLRRKFSQTAILSSCATQKSKINNFLTGDYNIGSGADLPIEGMAFVGTRMMIVSIILSLFFIIQTVLVISRNKVATKVVSGLYKRPPLNLTITKPIIRRARKNPDIILRKLKSQEKIINQEVKVIQSSLQINALSKLMRTLNFIEGQDVELTRFTASEDQNIDFSVTAKDIDTLTSIKSSLENDSKIKWFIELNKKQLTLTAGGKQK